MGGGARYIEIVSDSHFWSDLEQLLGFFNIQEMTQEYLITGLENTKGNNYELQELKKVTSVTTPYFLNLTSMIKYVKKEYDNDKFIYLLKNTINNGIDLIEVKNKLKMERKEIYNCLDTERDYQDQRWDNGMEVNRVPDVEKPISEWISYIEYHINKAKEANYHLDKEEALAQIRKVTAIGVRVMEIHGCPERIIEPDIDKIN